MNRILQIRARMDDVIRSLPAGEQRDACIHLYGVSQACALLALQRGVDAELAAVAGMLHDIWSYAHAPCPEHGPLGAGMARALMEELGCFTPGEADAVCAAIAVHSDKAGRHGPLAEVLIDADVMQHCLYDPTLPPSDGERARFERLIRGD